MARLDKRSRSPPVPLCGGGDPEARLPPLGSALGVSGELYKTNPKERQKISAVCNFKLAFLQLAFLCERAVSPACGNTPVCVLLFVFDLCSGMFCRNKDSRGDLAHDAS